MFQRETLPETLFLVILGSNMVWLCYYLSQPVRTNVFENTLASLDALPCRWFEKKMIKVPRFVKHVGVE